MKKWKKLTVALALFLHASLGSGHAADPGVFQEKILERPISTRKLIQRINEKPDPEQTKLLVQALFDRLKNGGCTIIELSALNIHRLLEPDSPGSWSDETICLATCADVASQKYHKPHLLIELLEQKKTPRALNVLGICYAYGYSKCLTNKATAVALWGTAAAQGNFNAYANLGHHYEKTGKKEKALKYYQLAAEKGIVWAKYALIQLEKKGGAPESAQTIHTYLQCAQAGWVPAQQDLKNIFKVKPQPPLPEDFQSKKELEPVKALHTLLLDEVSPFFLSLADYSNNSSSGGLPMPYTPVLKKQSEKIVNLLYPYINLTSALFENPQNFCTLLEPKTAQDPRVKNLFFDHKWLSVEPGMLLCLQDNSLATTLERLKQCHRKTTETVKTLFQEPKAHIEWFIKGMHTAFSDENAVAEASMSEGTYLFFILKNYTHPIDLTKLKKDIEWLEKTQQKFEKYLSIANNFSQIIRSYLATAEEWHNALYLHMNPWWEEEDL